VTDPPDTLANGERVTPPTERADNPALVFAAVQQDQLANEADPTPDVPEPHGAFTAALLETLQVLPADAPASLVYQRVKAMLEGNGVADQEPDLDANAARRGGGDGGRGQGAVGGAEGGCGWERVAGHWDGLWDWAGEYVYGDHGQGGRASGDAADR
jgi:hypothetical protein